jgi:hypothetical protein
VSYPDADGYDTAVVHRLLTGTDTYIPVPAE